MEESIRDLEKQMLDFLNQLERKYNRWSLRSWLGKPRYLWLWQKRVPLLNRWQAILKSNKQLNSFLKERDIYLKTKEMAILDLGCGFGMYWPIFMKFGFKKFVGVDLFDLRKNEKYLTAAKAFVKHFCPFDKGCETQLIMDDVRNLFDYKLIVGKFDIVLAVAVSSTKINSTAIPEELFNKIADQYGKRNCFRVYTNEIV